MPRRAAIALVGRPLWWVPVAMVLAVVAALTGWSISREFEAQRSQVSARLATTSELRAGQVAAWIDRQMSLATFLAGGRNLGAMLVRKLDQGDDAALQRLMSRAVAYRRANEADGASIVDADGQTLASEPGIADPVAPPELREAVRRAIDIGAPVRTEIYRSPGSAMPIRLDVVVPLLSGEGQARGAMLIRLDPQRTLFPLLSSWPVGTSGESMLWRQEGDRVVNVSDPRFGNQYPGQLSVPADHPTIAAARMIRGELPPGRATAVLDYRGVKVLAAGQPVAGTPWWIVSKIDAAEVDAPAEKVALWTVAAAAFGLLGAAIAARLWSQRQAYTTLEKARGAEREHLRTLRMLEAIAANASDAIFAKDLAGRYVFYNRAAAASLGRTPEEVIGRDDVELFGAQVAAELVARDAQAMKAGRPVLFDEEIPGTDGLKLVRCTKGPLFDPEGRLIGLFGVSHDETEARRAEQALRASEEELRAHRERLEELVGERTAELLAANASLASAARFNRALTDAIPGRVAYWDAGFRCRFANRNYAEWFGRTPEAMIGLTGIELVGAESFGSLQAQIEGAMAGRSQRFERERAEPDGRMAVHQIHWVPEIAPDGSVPGAYVMAFDITAIKQAQVELSAAKDDIERSRDVAEAANRAKSVFLANMSHEIRTPMNAIIGLTHLMSRDTRDTLQRERLGKVADAAQHLLQVINDVLDISKIEAGKVVLESTEFAVRPLLERSLQLVADRAREKGLELMVDTLNLPERLRGDATRLSQVLINLLSNAVKFTDRGWVRLRAEGRQRTARGIQLRIEVQDTGSGIAPDLQSRLFKVFEQIDGSATRSHGGTGLGLALTRQLAALMGGETGVTSEPGRGSTFWFTAELGLASEAGEAAAPVPTQSLRALLVDASVHAAVELASALRALGMQVQVAHDGEAAQAWAEAEFAQGRPCDVVFIDSRCGAPDGADTVARLRAALGAGVPPCVLVTGAASAPNGPCDSVLTLPFTASSLHDTLVRTVRKQGHVLAATSAPGESEALLKLRHAGQRVLLAEDNPVNRDVASELIRSAGLLIETAEDGASAVDLALSRKYDLVLMDMQMPVMDGLTATRRIRAKLGRGVPVIALTANAFVDDRAACIEAGMNDHVCKPVDPEVLYATLLRWLPLPERADPAQARTGPANTPLPQGATVLRERLVAIEGFTLATALRNVGGRMATVERVLGRFADSYRQGVPEWSEIAEGADRQALRQACHSVRGACAAIGAAEIEAGVREFERLLHDATACDALTPPAWQLNGQLKALVARLDHGLQR